VTVQSKILETRGNTLRFFLGGVDVAVANALRRIMLAEVPSMVIDNVVVIENSSPMRDEMVAHRLGLIPLKTDLDSYVLPEDCDCQSEMGCNKCSVTLTLVAEAVDATRTVYSKELKSLDPDVVPASMDIPILKLARGQRVRMETYARLGKGRDHAKWQPVSACAYTYASTISIDREKCESGIKDIEACPRHLLREEGNRIVVIADTGCDLCTKSLHQCPASAVREEEHDDAFIFTVESTGAIPPTRAVSEAIKLLLGKVVTFSEEVSTITAGKVA
jgi:DNA-directed RNA polymerase subunit D